MSLQAMAGGLLLGRTVLISGACGAMGQAAVRRFLAEGAIVHGIDRDGERGAALCADLDGAPFSFACSDLRDASSRREVVKAAQARLGRIDVLCTMAGASLVRRIEDSDDAVLTAQMEVNFVSVFELCRAVVPAMKAAGRGAIVNVVSELATVGLAGYSAYCASKGATLAFTRALAVELGPAGIRVNALCPGPTDTPMLHAEFASMADPVAEQRATIAGIPLGRLGSADEIAAAACFLASDQASFVHGATILVDGGRTAL